MFLGIGIVTLVTYLVTYPDPEKTNISTIPLLDLPILIASLISLFFYWKEKRDPTLLVHVIRMPDVLIGVDCFHLINLLENEIQTTRDAIICGASVFDIIFIIGLFAVFLDGLLIFQ